jgi:phenylalanyl-tRNA synthetase beta chain
MLELGQPLHAFDRDRLSGTIVVRRATAGEQLRTLDDVDRTLDPHDLVIADDSGPIALAGVMGGAATEISSTTTSIVLESAHFDPVSVAYTARRHRLGSEASRRFERGVDDELQPAGAESAVRLLAQLAGGSDNAAVTDVDHRGAERPRITLDPLLPQRLSGLTVGADRVRARLVDVGCTVADQAEGDDPALLVTPPSWRPDLRLPVDLVEEVIRLEGYDRLPSIVPAAPAGRGLTRVQRQRRVVGRALAAGGYAEVLTYPFVAASTADDLGLEPDDERRPSVRVANPVSAEEPFLRASLLPGLLVALGRNVRRGFSDVALFETGAVFRAPGKDAVMPRPPAGARPSDEILAAMDRALPDQPLHLAAALCGLWERPGWWGPGRPAGWSDAVEAARLAGSAVAVTVQTARASRPPWHPGRCAGLYVEGHLIGYGGELHPRVCEALDLPPRTSVMELSLAPLLAAAPEVVPAPAVSPYPPATLDVAVVVPADVPAAEVTAALRDGAGPLLESLRLFDLYTGEQVGPGRRSLAFSMRLRAADRTLTAEEVTAIRDQAVAAAADRCGAELRA